jgi:hypothetical protein
VFRILGSNPLFLIHQSEEPARRRLHRSFDAQAAGPEVGHYIDPPAAAPLRRTEESPVPGFKVNERTLDVLAGAKRVDAEIHTVAGEPLFRDAADFHAVGQAARRLHLKIRVNGVSGVEVSYPHLLGLSAVAPACNLFLVGGSPVVRRGHLRLRRFCRFHSVAPSGNPGLQIPGGVHTPKRSRKNRGIIQTNSPEEDYKGPGLVLLPGGRLLL